MAAAVELKGDRSSEEFRQLAAKAKDANQALAAIRDGKGRAEAARGTEPDRPSSWRILKACSLRCRVRRLLQGEQRNPPDS